MPMILDLQASVWRKILNPTSGYYEDTQVIRAMRCTIVPVSRLDQVGSFAYESTHLVWVPFWLLLRKEDQIRYGRRLIDAENDQVTPWIYTVNGRRSFTLGIPTVAYYAREQD